MRNGLRIGLFVGGLVLGLVGLFLWVMDMGSVNLAKVATPYGVEVWETETDLFLGADGFSTPEQLETADGELVFSGNLMEADAFIADRQEASELSWLEGGLMGIGVVLMASAFLPVYSREEPREEQIEREPALIA